MRFQRLDHCRADRGVRAGQGVDEHGLARLPTAGITPDEQRFGDYRLQLVGDDDFHRFTLSRGHVSLKLRYEGASARVLLEAVDSSAQGALLGVAGSSIVTRIREAWAAYRPVTWLDVRAGVVPNLAMPAIERAWARRAVDPVRAEHFGLLAPADLGATIRGELPDGYGWLAAGAFNGDGYTGRELNRNKNVEVAAAVHLLAGVSGGEPFGVLLGFTYGSEGAGSSRADRLTAGLLWSGERIGGGATMTYAWSFAGDGAKRSVLVSGFVRGRPIAGLLLATQVGHFRRSLDVDGDVLTTVTGASATGSRRRSRCTPR